MNHARRHILYALSIVVLCFIPLTQVPAADPENNADQQIGFADALFEEGDYFRSITEYKRFLFNYPSDPRIEKARYLIAQSYFRAGRWQEAEEAFTSFLERYPSGPFTYDALYFKALAEKNAKKYDQALSTLGVLEKISSGEVRDRAVYQRGLILIDRAEWNGARGAFTGITASSKLYPSARVLAQGLENADQLPRKDPRVAGALAAVLPGAGHLYADRPRDAAVAFLLNAAFIAAAIELFRHDDNITGGIVTFFELGWYAGNIYSAVNSAHKYNERVKAEFIQRLKENSALTFCPDQKGISIMYSFRF